ncbi:hypothetical protein JYU14_02450 [Simkania negevensis]|uniref:Uncharacterized protein n=1 Tax=Simkania negevensis TaxID=83561 RepID=A0ABS3ATF3_9BACT|nr:hypothetical protein [Simkania negevensis]
MSTLEKKLENRVQFWAVLGPFSIILGLFVSFLKPSVQGLYLPFTIMVGIPLCLLWQKKGLMITLTLIFLSVALNFHNIPIEDRFWQAGLAIVMALSFFVTTLSFEEVATSMKRMRKESESRLKNLLFLDEKLKSTGLQWHHDRENFSVKLKQMVTDADRVITKTKSYEQSLVMAEGEINRLHQEKEQLLNNVTEKSRKLFAVEHDIKELEDKNRELASLLAKKEEESTDFVQVEARPHTAPSSAYLSQLKADKVGKIAYFNIQLRTQKEMGRVQQEIIAYWQERAEKNHYAASLYHQLKNQFEEKKSFLRSTRASLFSTENSLTVSHTEVREKDLETTYLLCQVAKQIDELSEEKEWLENEAAALRSLVSHLLKQ